MSKNSLICATIMVFCAFLSAFSQILLKKSTLEKHRSIIFNYLNPKVIIAYSIFALTLLLNIYAFAGIEYKYASILNATAYIFTMFLSWLLLHDKISLHCFIGNSIIIIGIIIYVL